MGVRLQITVYSDSAEIAGNAIQKAVAQVKKCNRIFSDYSRNSEVVQLARNSPSQATKVSPELFYLLTEAQTVNRSTNGAFDVTLGKLTKLWRNARKDRKLPEPEVLTKALAEIGMQQVVLNPENRTVRTKTDLEFDFGGIAKGYAADLAMESLREDGLSIALIDLGGDLAVGDPPPEKLGWNIAIAPLKKSEPISRFITVSNCGIATSGDMEQFVEIDGKRYSHILDPKTGLGLQRRSSVTVIAEDATQADALASAYSVMSWDESRRHLKGLSFPAGLLVQEYCEGEWMESSIHQFPKIRTKK